MGSATSVVGRRLGRYHVREQIGRGGMGVVFLAYDERLKRDVALKLLPEGMFADETSRRRFQKEALILSRLNHPNIAIVHDFDTQDGADFLVTEFIAGESLTDRLRLGPMDQPTGIRLATQLVEGLIAAHEQGIVHRDLKPANLRVTPDCHLKILDFGLARVQPSPEMSTASVVEAGPFAGTLAYMSPEQLRGQTADARSDIWSVGVVFYEMFTGAHPFSSETASAIAGEILHRDVKPPSAIRSHISHAIERIILRCLDKEPDRRYQSAKELLVDLRRLSGGDPIMEKRGARWKMRAPAWIGLVLAVLGCGIAIPFALHRLPPFSSPANIHSLAVLPLANLAEDKSKDYFVDGLTDAVITNLAQIRALRVTSRTSVMRYKGSNKSLPEIARELGVDAIVEGSVEREGQHVRITAKLIRASDDAHIWVNQYESDLTNVLKLESDVARAIAGQVRIQVSAEERNRLETAGSVNPEAYEAYLLGRYHLAKWNERDLEEATRQFEKAIQMDPNFAAAYAALSNAWNERTIWGTLSLQEAEPQIRENARTALKLDSNLAEAHASIASVKFLLDLDWSGAEEDYRRAIELDPNNRTAHMGYATFLQATGRFPEAVSEIKRASELEPNSSRVESAFGRILYRARRYDDAITHLRQAIALDADNYGAYGRLADVYDITGDYRQALALAQQAEKMRGRYSAMPARYSGEIGRIHALMGNRNAAIEVVNYYRERAHERNVPFSLAAIYVGLDDKDQAFSWLNSAIEYRDLLVFVPTDPKFDKLHSDPRWQQFLRALHYPAS